MANTSNWSVCEIVCCIAAALIGVIVLLVTRGAFGGLAAVLFSAALAVILYVVLSRLSCGAATVAANAVPAAPERAAPGEMPAAPAAPPEVEAAPEPKQPVGSAEKAAPAVKSGTLLPGEADLSARKGVWTYQGHGAAPVTASGAVNRPETLNAPRGGRPDDLKAIKGVGPKLETLLHEVGIYHFDQIAAWGPAEIEWIDENLQGFKGRVTRDDWVAQAKTLAAGGETEFSKRVESGDVY